MWLAGKKNDLMILSFITTDSETLRTYSSVILPTARPNDRLKSLTLVQENSCGTSDRQ